MMKKKQDDYNLLPIGEDYFNNIFGEISEMKALILDDQTSGIISIIYTQTKLYKNDIYLIQKIEDVKEKLMHLKGVYFIRPTKQNINHLKNQIENPHFKEYHFFFTNQISQNFISQLAEVDKSDRIKTLQEVYLDYYSVGRNIFSLKIPSTIPLMKPRNNWKEPENQMVDRIAQGLISVVMSLRVIPLIKFVSDSNCCAQIAKKVAKKMDSQMKTKPSDYPKDERAILIITERKQDVITPLMTPWSYESMLHEYFGIFNNKVDIKNKQRAFLASEEEKVKNQNQTLKKKEERQFVLSQIEDQFYRKNCYSAFGELASNIKTFISEVSSKRSKSTKLQSLQEMHEVLGQMPELNALAAAVEKHVNLSVQISNQLEKNLIFQVSRIEQDLVCQDNRKDNIQAIWKIMKNQKIEYFLKLKMILLFSVKYPNDKQIKSFLQFLQEVNPDKSMLNLVNLLGYYQNGRKSDLFHTKNLKKKAVSYFDRIFSDVPNVYTQHRPYLIQNTVPEIINDKIKQNEYKTAFYGRQSSGRNKPIVILFYVGGVTYTEAKEAEQFEDARLIVGGTFVHNSKTFISEVIQLEMQQQSNYE